MLNKSQSRSIRVDSVLFSVREGLLSSSFFLAFRSHLDKISQRSHNLLIVLLELHIVLFYASDRLLELRIV